VLEQLLVLEHDDSVDGVDEKSDGVSEESNL
jgi:hypothetical protein